MLRWSQLARTDAWEQKEATRIMKQKQMSHVMIWEQVAELEVPLGAMTAAWVEARGTI